MGILGGNDVQAVAQYSAKLELQLNSVKWSLGNTMNSTILRSTTSNTRHLGKTTMLSSPLHDVLASGNKVASKMAQDLESKKRVKKREALRVSHT